MFATVQAHGTTSEYAMEPNLPVVCVRMYFNIETSAIGYPTESEEGQEARLADSRYL